MSRLLTKFILSTGVLLPLSAAAASPAATPSGSDWSFNVALFALVMLILVLVLANALLAHVLQQLALACRDNFRKSRIKQNVIKSLLLAAAFLVPAANALAQTTAEVEEAPVSPFISGIPRTEFYFLIGMIGFLLLVMVVLLVLIRMLARELRGIPAKAHIPRVIFKKNFLDVFNKSVAIEQEASIVLDHEYDGIHELDNDLPPWWKWGFVLTIIVAFVYIGYYHAAGGPSQAEEYIAAVEKGEEEKAAYLAKTANNVDENTVTMVMDAGELAAAGNIFQTTCAACHAKDGGGGVGPNLTDDFWLHGGGIKDVFKSVKYGWPDKGMKSWKDDYSPKQIAALASYVKSLKGTKPLAPKAAQGELFVEGGDKAIDSVSQHTDPSLEPTGKKENKDNPIGPYTPKAK